MTADAAAETAAPGASLPRREGTLRLLSVVLVTSLSAVALLAATGGIAGAPAQGLPDPGAITRWGLPTTRAVRDSTTFLTLGALVVATCMVPTRKNGLVGKAQLRLAAMAVIAGSVWLWSAVMEFVLAYADISGQEPQQATIEQLRFFATEIGQGSYLAWNILLAGIATFIALAARTVTGLGVAAVLAVAALWAVALTGHAATDGNHDLAVNLQFLHLVGIGLWIGCLVGVLWVHRHPDTHLRVLVSRYSRLAGWCFAAVAISGVGAALVRVPRLGDLASSYGLLLGIKVFAFGLLGALGWWQRTRVVESLATTDHQSAARTLFTRLAVLEVAFMALAAGAGAALSRTPPPGGVAAEEPTPTEALLGHAMPPGVGVRAVVHRVAHRLVLGAGRRRRGTRLPRRRTTPAQARRRLATRAHNGVAGWLPGYSLGHQRTAGRLRRRAVQHAHGSAHDGRDRGADLASYSARRSPSRCAPSRAAATAHGAPVSGCCSSCTPGRCGSSGIPSSRESCSSSG